MLTDYLVDGEKARNSRAIRLGDALSMSRIMPLGLYQCQPADAGAAPFEATVVTNAEGLLRVVSTHNGVCAIEPQLHSADLVIPEQQFYDWRIVRQRLREIEIPDELLR